MMDYGREFGEIPAHLLVFFTLPTKPIRAIRLNDSYVTEAGDYVFCHVLPSHLNDHTDIKTATDDNYTELAHPDQRLIFYCQKWDKSKHGAVCSYNEIKEDSVSPSLRIESAESISGPCTAIPEFYDTKPSNHRYYVLRPHADWAPDFAREAHSFMRNKKI